MTDLGLARRVMSGMPLQDANSVNGREKKELTEVFHPSGGKLLRSSTGIVAETWIFATSPSIGATAPSPSSI